MTTTARFIIVLFSWLKESHHVRSGFAVSQSVVSRESAERGAARREGGGGEDRVDPVSTDQRLCLLLNINMHVLPGLNQKFALEHKSKVGYQIREASHACKRFFFS
jgi:hypothetical protein